MNEELLVLLNSYLDGQLTAGQRQKLEEQLALDAKARQMLAELRQVSGMVGKLPTVTAPAELAERVYQELEREALLGQEEPVSDNLGRHHLRLRSFLAAAAMIALAGAIVLIAYTTFSSNHSAPAGKPEIIADPGLNLKNLDNLLQPAVKPEIKPVESTPPSMVVTAVAPELPAYSSVHLVMNVRDVAAARGQLRTILDDQSVHDVLHTQPAAGQHQYAFICSLEQLRQVVPGLIQVAPAGLDLAIGETSASTILKNIQPAQILALAASRDMADYLRQEKAASEGFAANVPAEEFAINLLQRHDFVGQLDQADPAASDLSVRLLGPEALQDSAAQPARLAPVAQAATDTNPDMVAVTLLLQPVVTSGSVSQLADPNK